MDKFSGGEDPFDHPFLNGPFDGFFGGKSQFDDPFSTCTTDKTCTTGYRKQITVEEFNPDDDAGRNEYPYGTRDPSFSFQRAAYGGRDGWYYTSSVVKRTGGAGVSLMEMKEEDRTVGESLHTISKGLRDKGHSVTTKQFSDGKVDSMQTLHNLQEDELTVFQENWKVNADKYLPGWNDGFNSLENTRDSNDDDVRKSWVGHYSLENLGNGDEQPGGGYQGPSARGPSTRIVPVE